MYNHWLVKRDRKDFLAELRTYFMVFTPAGGDPRPMWNEGKEPDFKPLYAKYPRVRIGIRRALYILMQYHKRKTCHA